MSLPQVIDRSESQIQLRDATECVPAARRDLSVMDLIAMAIEQKTPPEQLEKLMELSIRADERKAAKEYAEAMAAFKRDCPPVPRRTENAQFTVTRNGTKRPRMFASLEDVEATVKEPLGRHGLSYRWTNTRIANGYITVTCEVKHVGGHRETSDATYPIDSRAGCSEQQKVKSAKTYAKSDSLQDALGIETCEDNDGNDEPDAGPAITEHQAANLDALIADVGADKRRFLAHFGIEAVADLPASRFAEACKALESKRKASK